MLDDSCRDALIVAECGRRLVRRAAADPDFEAEPADVGGLYPVGVRQPFRWRQRFRQSRRISDVPLFAHVYSTWIMGIRPGSSARMAAVLSSSRATTRSRSIFYTARRSYARAVSYMARPIATNNVRKGGLLDEWPPGVKSRDRQWGDHAPKVAAWSQESLTSAAQVCLFSPPACARSFRGR